jgi:DNA-binding NtrC family response regulator
MNVWKDRDLPPSLRRPRDRQELATRLGIVGQSAAIHQVVVSVAQIAPTDSTVLITGETGAGKGLVARAVHTLSKRRTQPFMALNVSALNEGTMESELFGHVKGAFTNAVRDKKGIFELAARGTVFLDEIGDVTPPIQVRLLRVLEEREFRRVGGDQVLTTEARFITATNRNLEYAVSEGDFREDLYYRLKVFEIRIPPVRERKEDIPLLVRFFLERFCRDNEWPVPTVEDDALRVFATYDWPGNVRELRTVTEQMMVLNPGAKSLHAGNVPDVLQGKLSSGRLLPAIPKQQQQADDKLELNLIYRALLELRNDVSSLRDLIVEKHDEMPTDGWVRNTSSYPVSSETEADVPVPPLDDDGSFVDVEVRDDGTDGAHVITLKDLEREAIRKTLHEVEGNRREAARRLGIGERTLYRKLREYDLS